MHTAAQPKGIFFFYFACLAEILCFSLLVSKMDCDKVFPQAKDNWA